MIGLHRKRTLAELRRILQPAARVHTGRRIQKLLYLKWSLPHAEILAP
jgi:hypothetical protein